MDTGFFDGVDWPGLLGKALAAVAILVITWIVAMIVKSLFTKLSGKIPALQRAGADGASVGTTLGSIGSLVVWMLGLVAILQVLGLSQVLTPIQGMADGVLGFLPNLIGAGIVFFVGALLAKVVRQLVETALAALPFAALQILGIASISRPAEQMLQSIFDAVPVIIAAGIMLALGVFIARFAGDIVEQVLDGIGVDRQLADLDVLPQDTKVVPIIARIVQIGIVLFFAVMAAQLLDFPQITAFLSEVLGLGGKVIFGAAIIAAGLFIANLLAKLLSGAGATIVKYATIVLFVAMGLKYMGIADSIIELGFGALVVGGAAAAALAFGLGGRDAAARTLDKLSAKAEQQSSAQGDQQV